MHVVMHDLKLGEIKGSQRSKEKGYLDKRAHVEGNSKSFSSLLLKGFEVRLWGVQQSKTPLLRFCYII